MSSRLKLFLGVLFFFIYVSVLNVHFNNSQ